MRRGKGFTLVELSVAFVIIVLLLAGAMIPLSTQIELRSVADTQRSMEQIREAIIGFAQANGRLPCPANGATAAGVVGAGTEQLNGNTCNVGGVPVRFGVVPWATLGTPETDAWGRRFSYSVSSAFSDVNGNGTWATANPPSPVNQTPACGVPAQIPVVPGAPTSFALCTLGDIAVFTKTDGTIRAVLLAGALPAVIVSHGRNGFGAWQSNGIQRNPLPAGGTYEAANVNGNTQQIPSPLPTGYYQNWIFYSRSPTSAAGGCVDPAPNTTSAAASCEFDDIVVMISSQALIARMVAAGRLP